MAEEKKDDSIYQEEDDLFEEVFGTDEEKELAKKRMAEKLKASESKKKETPVKKETDKNESSEKEEPNREFDEEVDEVSNQIKEKNKDFDEELDDDEIDEEAEVDVDSDPLLFVDTDALDKEAKMIDEKNEKKKETTGKLNLKVIHTENSEDEEKKPKKKMDKASDLEKNIIKNVIKNKAASSVKEELFKKQENWDFKKEAEDIANKPEGKKVDDNIVKIKPKLNFLEHEESGHAYIGRKKSILTKYGEEAGLFVGRVGEEELNKKQVYLDGLNPHVVFVCGARGSGKCVTGDTLITLDNGEVKPISELEFDNNKVLGIDNTLKIRPLEKVGFYERKVNKILKVKLRSGKEIKLTPEHPLLTINGWQETQKLHVKDRIATPRQTYSFGNLKMKECDVKLLAYLISEGHLSNQFVLFCNSDKEIINDFTKSINEFDETLKIKNHGKFGFRISQKKKKMDISNIKRNEKGQFLKSGFVISQQSSIMQWLKSINLYNKNSFTKTIPKQIMQVEKEQLSLFLNRYFSCDGTIHRINKTSNWQISVCSVSETIIKQMQHLLLRFGIVSKIRTKKTKPKNKIAYELIINSVNVIKFINEIGFFGKKAEKEKIAFVEMKSKKINPNTDTIPRDIWKKMKPINWHKIARELGYKNQKSMHNVQNYSPSRGLLQKISVAQRSLGGMLIAESDIFWDEIDSIEEIFGEVKVYDISVPSFSNFVANDIIIHNSYVLGVIAEELALKNKNVGIVVVDPIGVFWSMKHPNKDEKELEILADWEIMPQGLDNIKVFIPIGMKNSVPKSTYDATFSIQPSLLTAEDWCLTFGMDRFSPVGLLLDKVLEKVKKGFTTVDEENPKNIRGKENTYSLDDLIYCLDNDNEINGGSKGYKPESIRALVSRFDAAKSWGIFDESGTPLSLLSRAGQMTILDTSFLDDTVGALVIGIISRRLLSARKLSTRREAAGKFEDNSGEELIEINVPPTWLFIDEAHTLIPGGNQKTPASNAIVEYVKQGRRPGLSLVFATQQPSAIDSKVLSQLDVIMAHKLVFDDDVKAIYKRTPTIIPGTYKKPNFIKTLPVGTALTGDRQETTTRAFVMNIRPRMSQHEGRDAETIKVEHNLDDDQVQKLALSIVRSKLEKDPIIKISLMEQILETLNATYSKNITIEQLLEILDKEKIDYDEINIYAPGVLKEMEEEKKAEKERSENASEKESDLEEDADEETAEQGEDITEETLKEKAKSQDSIDSIEEEEFDSSVELTALKSSIEESEARIKLANLRLKKRFGLFGEEEFLDRLNLKYSSIYKIKYNYFSQKDAFQIGEVYVDSLTCEFIHDKNGSIVRSTGLKEFKELNESEILAIKLLENKHDLKSLSEKMEMEEGNIKRVLEKLAIKDMVGVTKTKDDFYYFLKKEFDLPPSPLHSILSSIGRRPIIEVESISIIEPKYTEKEIAEVVKKLWKNITIREITQLFLPVWQGVLKKKTGEERIVMIDGINGKQIKID